MTRTQLHTQRLSAGIDSDKCAAHFSASPRSRKQWSGESRKIEYARAVGTGRKMHVLSGSRVCPGIDTSRGVLKSRNKACLHSGDTTDHRKHVNDEDADSTKLVGQVNQRVQGSECQAVLCPEQGHFRRAQRGPEVWLLYLVERKTPLVDRISMWPFLSHNKYRRRLLCPCRESPWHDDSSHCKTFSSSSTASWIQHEDK